MSEPVSRKSSGSDCLAVRHDLSDAVKMVLQGSWQERDFGSEIEREMSEAMVLIQKHEKGRTKGMCMTVVRWDLR